MQYGSGSGVGSPYFLMVTSEEAGQTLVAEHQYELCISGLQEHQYGLHESCGNCFVLVQAKRSRPVLRVNTLWISCHSYTSHSFCALSAMAMRALE